jgi:protein phosphatase 2C family protein 2/3
MLVENACYVANVGDSRALMSAAGGQKLFVLSRDHRPNEDTEKSRITEHGGKIY